MNGESEDLAGENFQSASEDGDCSDKDFHSPVSQQHTEASESPSPPNNFSTLQQVASSPPVEFPIEGAEEAACIQEEVQSIPEERETPSAVPITDVCKPPIAQSSDVAADDSIEMPDPQVSASLFSSRQLCVDEHLTKIK